MGLERILPQESAHPFLQLVAARRTSVKRTPLAPQKRCPARLYLSQLQGAGRRAMEAKLRLALRVMGLTESEIRWSGLRFEIVAAIRALMIEYPYAPSTINATLSALRGVAHAAWALRQIRPGELERIRDVKSVRGTRLPRGRALSLAELERLVAVCARDSSPSGRRDLAILALLERGLRRAEAASLSLASLDMEAQTVRVLGKGNKERIVYLKCGNRRALSDWINVRGTSDGALLCPVSKAGEIALRPLSDQSIYMAIKRRARQARVRHISPHDLRHTHLTRLLEGGADLATVADLAGHSNVSTTRIYDHRNERAKRRASGLVSLPYRRSKR